MGTLIALIFLFYVKEKEHDLDLTLRLQQYFHNSKQASKFFTVFIFFHYPAL